MLALRSASSSEEQLREVSIALDIPPSRQHEDCPKLQRVLSVPLARPFPRR